MKPVASYRGNNVYEVELTEGFWIWKRRFVKQVYLTLTDGFCWMDTDEQVTDLDVIIALNEAYHKHMWPSLCNSWPANRKDKP